MQEAGHESNACSKPKTTENKQCYSCGGVGHLASDCPSIRVGAFSGAGPKCYQCGQFGHIARSCVNAPAAPVVAADGTVAPVAPVVPRPLGARVGGFAPRGGFAGGRGGFMGPRGANRCYGCGGFGHRAANCPTTARQFAPKTCYSCQQPGHIARDCPNAAAAAPVEPATIA
ncbi:gig suppressor [Rhodosporidiobolus nylandii]